MTCYLWDQSHYDGPITRDVASRARAEGIVAITHKVGEGTGGDDPLDGTALAAARDAGVGLIGGYHVVRSGLVTPQVDELIRLADRDEPWWRGFDGWFWQVDLERWPYDAVLASTGIAFARELRQRTGRVVVIYASHGQYGDQLTDWDGPLWNADYVSNTPAPFTQQYPGDDWRPWHGLWRGGWTPYSGRAPEILQYSSSATIAGLTTCDASAYRGTPRQLESLLKGDDMSTIDDILARVTYIDVRMEALTQGLDAVTRAGPAHGQAIWPVTAVKDLAAAVSSLSHQVADLQAAVSKISSPTISLTDTQIATALRQIINQTKLSA